MSFDVNILQTENRDANIDLFSFKKVELSQEILNIEVKKRSNLFSWNGQFSPQLIEALLREYAFPNFKVFDPFMGSGTVLVESATLGLATFGTEINPAAFQFASTYKFCRIALNERKKYVEDIQNRCINLIKKSDDYKIQHDLLQGMQELHHFESKELYKTFLLYLDYKNKETNKNRIQTLLGKFCNLIYHLPLGNNEILPLNRDARKTMLPENTFDLVLTSPPYINVFNYHQQYRATIEEFGYNLLEVARSEIGSNRKHRANRFLTVIQYVIDMAMVFKELKRICKPNARIIFVVGRESNVKKTKFLNSEIVTKIAIYNSNFSYLLKQERLFKNKFGENIYEDIIHFTPFSKNKLNEVSPYEIALETLLEARPYCPNESKNDLEDAIKKLYTVKESPFYNEFIIHEA